ncbi:pyrophosphohydrolase domain-containing protein [Neolewinella antarctica]|uniref:HAD superfamily Cof-like phosphohydrolase n=1 Tax=Neolewinella antarctica TaxID=442734 RepID=A0ABX0X6X4_9BACT|nr:nucleoside triphosphate pyrophosphohydrolase family protein [Neolewinella antarctica]NJC24975.1 putative HAD superfamily Cof-like phosphohydrolase [Neolewinella antarctica]
MKSPQALESVAEFHRTFHLPVLDAPVIPSADRCRLRINLLREELDELEAALADNDLVEVADACADLQYVLSGAILEFGLGQKFAGIFDEVHRSNMSKTCATVAEAAQTIEHYGKLDQAGKIVPSGEVFLVHRIEDGKVLKNVHYSAADIKGQLAG